MTWLGERMRATAAEHPDREAVFAAPDGTETSETLAAVHAAATRSAAALQRRGIRPQDVVALRTVADLPGVVAHAAVVLTGATVLPLAPTLGPRELAFELAQSGTRLLIAPDIGRPLPPVDVDVLAALPSDDEAFYSPPDLLDVDRALLVYTSGTTAEPKGVQHSHRTLQAELDSMRSMFAGGDDEMHLAVFPTGHVAGFLGLLRFLVLGVPVVSMTGWDPAVAARLVDRHHVTSSVGVPTHLAGILDAAEREGLSTASLREYMLGAAPVPQAMVERADALGIRAFRTYGSSEHPTISSGRAADPRHKRVGTDGRPTPGTAVRIVDEHGADLPVDTDGEILCTGPEQFLGYLDPALDEGTRFGEWLRTGDVGRLDGDGHLTVTDRIKDIIVRGGENISSRLVEEVVARHPDVVEAAAVGLPDERLGEKVAVFVVLRDGGAYDVTTAARQFATHGVTRAATPERVVAVRSLPRTPAGKVRKTDLRLLLASGGPVVNTNVSNRDPSRGSQPS